MRTIVKNGVEVELISISQNPPGDDELLAEEMGISQPSMSNLLRGERRFLTSMLGSQLQIATFSG